MPKEDPFDPTQFHFIKIRGFKLGGMVAVFEHQSHAVVDGAADFLRLNVFLSEDSGYVTIWRGLLEAMFTEAALNKGEAIPVEMPPNFDFAGAYDEILFRGHIESGETARHVLKALRVTLQPKHSALAKLGRGKDGKLACLPIESKA